ncbi:MAG: PIN domain-containing protein [Candidatus Marinimicrobia bacterium]|nr:PIN domain-containing protein [Candidatus Neomarinimicrobiota bacterium]
MKLNKVFIDSNILIYAYDRSARSKREAAKRLISDLITTGLGTISTQVLQEFYVVSTKKLGIIPELAKTAIESLRALEIVTLSPELILSAIDTQLNWDISFWDALILQAASHSNCKILYTEDFSHGQSYGSVKVVNPFIL